MHNGIVGRVRVSTWAFMVTAQSAHTHMSVLRQFHQKNGEELWKRSSS